MLNPPSGSCLASFASLQVMRVYSLFLTGEDLQPIAAIHNRESVVFSRLLMTLNKLADILLSHIHVVERVSWI